MENWYLELIRDLYRNSDTELFISEKLSSETPSFYDPIKNKAVINSSYHKVHGYIGFACIHELGHGKNRSKFPFAIRPFNEYDGSDNAGRAANEFAINAYLDHHFANNGRDNWKDVIDIYEIPYSLDYLVIELIEDRK